jgi:hypothetical protein
MVPGIYNGYLFSLLSEVVLKGRKAKVNCFFIHFETTVVLRNFFMAVRQRYNEEGMRPVRKTSRELFVAALERGQI